MLINAATERAFETIAARAADVQRAFTPGAIPQFGDAGAQPSSHPSLDPLCVAPPPDAYFVTTDERGRTAYTQDGAFSLRDGALVTRGGAPVLDLGGNELRCDSVDAALGRIQNLRIEPDGTLAYERVTIDPRSGARERQRVAAGRIALARFPAGTRLGITAPGDRVTAPPGVVPHAGRPGDGNFAPVAPLREANSRIDFDRSLDRLEEAYVTFDALQAAHKSQGSLSKTAMDLLK